MKPEIRKKIDSVNSLVKQLYHLIALKKSMDKHKELIPYDEEYYNNVCKQISYIDLKLSQLKNVEL